MQLESLNSFILELSSCSGNDFQDEVARLFARNFEDYHFVTTLPSGDGGVDGLYGSCTTMIFCYGLRELELQRTNSQKKKAIIEKFTKDLMRVLELESAGRGRYQRRENTQLEGIMRGAGKVNHIKFICNWNEDNSILGELRTKLNLLLKQSVKKFVDANCECTFLGPKEVVELCPPTKSNITNLRYPKFSEVLREIEEGNEQELNVEDPVEFESKFEDLQNRFGINEQRLNRILHLREKTETSWMAHIMFIEKLATESVLVHESILNVRNKIVQEMEVDFIREPMAPLELLERYSARAKEEFIAIYPRWDEERLTKVVDMLIASLLGECPLDWREEGA